MKYTFIGWCKEGTHDKVWVCININNSLTDYACQSTYLTVWGRRGKALQHKIIVENYPKHYYDLQEDHDNSSLAIEHSWSHVVGKKINEKIKKGYQSIDEAHLNEVYPEFEEDLNMLAVWATLST
jgi:hypothetical protein